MQLEEFWKIVEVARSASSSDPDERVDALRAALSRLSLAQLQEFQAHYDALHARAYRWDLWGAAYVMNGGCSDDGFHYFRDWLISEGREVYEAALRDPESLAALPRVRAAENEPYGYVARGLFEEAGGGELERSASTQPSEPVGTAWDESEINGLYPRLAEKYTD
ncbi:MAG: DUF4240 domain-containing protein [Planctomycetes bacterium]|nr:DUF4240 domain-containing protein [Planctomycetota bacterium]